MTSKEVEKRLNISKANIRFYEKEGLLEPKRNINGYRDYSEADIERLEKILLFRKCNISIENIRLIFNGSKTINEVFTEQISVIENEIKELEGAKIICNELAQEKSSVDHINTEKYIHMMHDEEEKGNKFYDIAEDYILSSEKLYQSIIENDKFKGDTLMKRSTKIGIYVANTLLLFIFLVVFEFAFSNSIEWNHIIIITLLFTVADVLGTKKYIENKTGKKFTKKQNIRHYTLTLMIAIIALLGYQTIHSIYEVNKDPNPNVLEMSVKKSIIDIANNEYKNDGHYTYAENHDIQDYKLKNNNIYVYVAADYGLFSQNGKKLKSYKSRKSHFTLVYKDKKNKNGIYELKNYKEKVLSENE